jgi:transposase
MYSPPDFGFVSWIAQAEKLMRHRRDVPSAYFDALPARISYDNTKIAVAHILGGEERVKTRAFSELQSHHLFADKFGRPAKGNNKGKIEGLVGYARRNFMVPLPRVNSWDELNVSVGA